MNKEMVISSTSHETRVAILEDDQVVEIFIEREHSRGVVGNIYKGRVSKVLPGMQSAFVDLGLERDAFLYVTDVIDPTAESLEDEDESPTADPEVVAPDADPEHAEGESGDASKAGSNGRRSGRDRDRTPPDTKIEDLLKEGQEVVVQVVKEPLGTKGGR